MLNYVKPTYYLGNPPIFVAEIRKTPPTPGASHLQEANIHGLRCREFEADLRLGERLMGGEPIRVKLTKTISFCRRTGSWVSHTDWLVGSVWNIHLMIVPYIGNFIIPTDEYIFQRGGSTTNQYMKI